MTTNMRNIHRYMHTKKCGFQVAMSIFRTDKNLIVCKHNYFRSFYDYNESLSFHGHVLVMHNCLKIDFVLHLALN